MKLKKSYGHKTPIFLKDIDIEKVLVSNNISFGEKICKYFIGYMYIDNKSKPLKLCIFFHHIITRASLYI